MHQKRAAAGSAALQGGSFAPQGHFVHDKLRGCEKISRASRGGSRAWLARRERAKIGECSVPHDPILALSQRRQTRFGDRRGRPGIFSQPLSATAGSRRSDPIPSTPGRRSVWEVAVPWPARCRRGRPGTDHGGVFLTKAGRQARPVWW